MSDTKQTRPFDEARAAALEALLAEVRPGPWEVQRPASPKVVAADGVIVAIGPPPQADPQGASGLGLIAAARNELPDLLAAWRAERARAEDAEAMSASWKEACEACYGDKVEFTDDMPPCLPGDSTFEPADPDEDSYLKAKARAESWRDACRRAEAERDDALSLEHGACTERDHWRREAERLRAGLERALRISDGGSANAAERHMRDVLDGYDDEDEAVDESERACAETVPPRAEDEGESEVT